MTDTTTPTDLSVHPGTSPTGRARRGAAYALANQLLRDQLTRVGVITGQKILDLTGIADLSYLSRLVGPTGHITSIDSSPGRVCRTSPPATTSSSPTGYRTTSASSRPRSSDTRQ